MASAICDRAEFPVHTKITRIGVGFVAACSVVGVEIVTG
jgi:hypothetical protein